MGGGVAPRWCARPAASSPQIALPLSLAAGVCPGVDRVRKHSVDRVSCRCLPAMATRCWGRVANASHMWATHIRPPRTEPISPMRSNSKRVAPATSSNLSRYRWRGLRRSGALAQPLCLFPGIRQNPAGFHGPRARSLADEPADRFPWHIGDFRHSVDNTFENLALRLL